jgi:hypothetical protein
LTEVLKGLLRALRAEFEIMALMRQEPRLALAERLGISEL